MRYIAAEKMSRYPLNSVINNYYHEKVEMCRREVKKTIEIVNPIVEKLITAIHERDPRFQRCTINTGSYYQGLKVSRADEFDFSVPLYVPERFVWSSYTPRYYGFNRQVDDPSRTLPDDVRVIRSGTPLPRPPTGSNFVIYSNPRNPPWNTNKKDMCMDDDIIPFLVKKRFKDLLVDAIRDLDLRDKVRKDRWVHGPSVTIKITDPRIKHEVSIDFCPVIDMVMSSGVDTLPNCVDWPRLNRAWPPREKIQKIKEAGCELVGKQNLYWRYGFVKAEKILIDQIDSDGGCRKKLQRILKKLNEDVFCNTTKKAITSYCLKTLLFWECENYHPGSADWDADNISERLMEMVKHLREAVARQHIQHYFITDINLFQSKDKGELIIALGKIDEFLNFPLRYLQG